VFAVLYIVSFGELKNLVPPSLMPPGNLTESDEEKSQQMEIQPY
jgi:hypothetical protein